MTEECDDSNDIMAHTARQVRGMTEEGGGSCDIVAHTARQVRGYTARQACSRG